MSAESEEVLDLVKKHGDKVAKQIYPDKSLAMYVLHVGIETIKSRDRRRVRREIKSEIKPKFVQDTRSSSPYAVRFAKETLVRMKNRGRRLVDDWLIGGLVLGDFTKEELLDAAGREQLSSDGHLINSRIYTALAAPLDSGQLMRSYWTYEMAADLIKGLTDQPNAP